MEYLDEYYSPYKELVITGYQDIYTKDINKSNIDLLFDHAINILKDGIETLFVQSMKIHVHFVDRVDINLSIFDYLFNLMFWRLRIMIDKSIHSVHLFFPDDITQKYCKEYIDNVFIDKNRRNIDIIALNQIIDGTIGKFREFRRFQTFLSNSLNLEDTIELMNKYPEFWETMHLDVSNIPLEDVKEYGMEMTHKQIQYIKDSNHCLSDSFRTGEAVSPKQYKEVAVNIGSKPDGQGSVYPIAVNKSFLNGGLQNPTELFIESSNGRVAQILQKNNVGESGEFARKLELNNQDTRLYPDPNYCCGTRNFIKVEIDSETKLRMYDLRYYRENPFGLDKFLDYKRDKHLIGKTLWFRSPMTCASAARGDGICYKCYGDLAYTSKEVNVGQIAAEGLSSIYTQTLLSAKHLLESNIIKTEWSEGFHNFFTAFFNTVCIKEGIIVKGYTMIIDEDIKVENEDDEIDYNYYINSFTIRDPQGVETKIFTKDADNLYFISDFLEFCLKNYNDDNTAIEIDMVDLFNFQSLFVMEIKNNELSQTMDKIKKLIDVKSVMKDYDKDSLLREFTNTNILGNITLNAVHFEVLLMNQIRDFDDELEKPDWNLPNASYQILTLSNSLAHNPSITVRLQSTTPSKVFLDPNSRNLYKPSVDDLYFMEQPQEFLENKDIISDEDVPDDGSERNIIEPISFDNPKIRVGRSRKKKKLNKKDMENPNNY
jgi:hypothetical protein